MKTGILDRKDVGVFARFIVVGMPVTCGSDKRGPRYPILLVAVLDHPSGIKFRPDHGVATRLAADDEIEGDRFMPVGVLDLFFPFALTPFFYETKERFSAGRSCRRG